MAATGNSKFWDSLWEVLKQQGINFIIITGVAYFLWIELQEVKAENKACNDMVIEKMTELIIENQRVIDQNTAAYQLLIANQNK